MPRSNPKITSKEASAPFLEGLVHRFHRSSQIGLDPLSWPRSYEAVPDREIAAFIASALAYGNVRQIHRSLERLFRRMGRSPARFVRDFTPGRSDREIEGVYHRFNGERDISLFLHLLGQILRSHGSLENFWIAAQPSHEDPLRIEKQADRFVSAFFELETTPYLPRLSRADRSSMLYLLPNVGGHSACKRFFLFLRWMVRPEDDIDLGLWRAVSPADLEYPLDTHILRLSRYLGATSRKDASARTRREITDFFRRFAPRDPVRFDFSLCRLGIERVCPTRSDRAKCETCGLRPVCLRHEAMTHRGRLPARLKRLELLDAPRTSRTGTAGGKAPRR